MGLSLLGGLLVLLSWLGMGQLLCARLKWKVEWPEQALAGIFGAALLALVANFFLPLGHPAIQVLVLGSAAWGAVHLARVLRRTGLTWAVALPYVAFFLTCVVLGNRGWHHIDSGGYHIQTVKWAALEPIAVGVSILHTRFGFNSLWHLISGLHFSPGVGLAGSFSVNPMLALVLLGFVWRAARKSTGVAGTFGAILLVCFLVVPGARSIFVAQLGTPSTDFPAAALFWIAILIALRPDEKGRNENQQLALIAALLSVLVKLATAPLFAVLAALYFWRTRTRWKKQLTLPALLAVAGGLWIVRNVLLSGCAVYPLAASCSPGLSWFIGFDIVAVETYLARAFARLGTGPYPPDLLSRWDWIPTWFRNGWEREIEFRAGVVLSVLGILAAAIARRKSRATLAHPVFLGTLLTWIFWFVQAPNLRYGYGPWLGLPALMLTPALVPVWEWVNRRHARRLAWALGLAIAFFSFQGLYKAKGIKGRHFTEAFPKLPAPRVVEREWRSGLKTLFPNVDSLCWDAPLGCTPESDSELCARRIAFGNWLMTRQAPPGTVCAKTLAEDAR